MLKKSEVIQSAMEADIKRQEQDFDAITNWWTENLEENTILPTVKYQCMVRHWILRFPWKLLMLLSLSNSFSMGMWCYCLWLLERNCYSHVWECRLNNKLTLYGLAENRTIPLEDNRKTTIQWAPWSHQSAVVDTSLS